MMLPEPAGTMRRPAACAHRKTPVRLMSTARRHSSTVTSSVGLLAEMPALVDQHVDAAPGLFHPGEGVFDGVGVGDGSLHRDGFAAVGCQLGHGGVQGGGVHVQQRDARALAHESLCRGKADAFGAAGDHDGLAAQVAMDDFSRVVQGICL